MTSDFQLWKDYFQLAKVVERIYREEDGLKETSLPEHGEASLEGNGQAEGLPCSFCKNNGESKHVYMSHRLKDATGRVRCPILRNYTCPQCGASDDAAHTRRFCPLTNKGYTSVYNSSIRNSAGKKKKASSVNLHY
ncbi:nanos homolog 3 [Elgaria multicarinata webbii]|uniref:nanos homolog 3 n=1 Tax=Elgaria multicarinata webbii TaxID=159646 RepID=UPI002FCD43FC